MMPRLDRARQKLREQELDALFVSTPENRRYLSGFTGSAGYLIVTQSQALVATDFRYYEQVRLQSPHWALIEVKAGGVEKWLPEVLQGLDARRLGIESHNMTVALHSKLAEIADKLDKRPHIQLTPTQGLVEEIRAVKEPNELASLQKAISIADAAFDALLEVLALGMTEKEVAWKLEMGMRERGAESTSFDTIVAAGPNGAMPHHHPTDRPLQRGEPVVIDFGAKYDGYCSDCTRTISLGRPDDTFSKVYDIVLGAQLTALANVTSGMDGKVADALARTVIEQAGYGDQFGHSLGHGVGLEIHEAPTLGTASTSKLESDMVFTVEPGIYIPGWGGVRIEDVAVLENGKARVLSKAKKTDSLGRSYYAQH